MAKSLAYKTFFCWIASYVVYLRPFLVFHVFMVIHYCKREQLLLRLSVYCIKEQILYWILYTLLAFLIRQFFLQKMFRFSFNTQSKTFILLTLFFDYQQWIWHRSTSSSSFCTSIVVQLIMLHAFYFNTQLNKKLLVN